jgi:homoserine O-succinyltransferase/O-acetyltransferase
VIDIALVNNMPDAALDATERQFRSLLDAAADGLPIRLTLYTLPEVPRSEFGRGQVSRYGRIEDLWRRQHDALIVTGTEPQAEELVDEPFWSSLTRLLDWAERHTSSTILSCLAAHAGIRYLDGIPRQRLEDKRFGVFECARVDDHALTASAPDRLRMPHSRWNDMPEAALRACGYRVLTRSPDAGVDLCVKERGTLFVFFQGHPEYDATALLLEYRRDIGRFLRGERESYPPMPRGYFDEALVDALDRLRASAIADRREERLADFPIAAAASRVTNDWRSTAERLYRNWLQYVAAHQRQPAFG